MPRHVHISAFVVLLVATISAVAQEGVSIRIKGPVRIVIGVHGDQLSAAGPTHGNGQSVEQCTAEDGFCIETGDRCNGTIKSLQNSCNDHCACCVPDKQAVCTGEFFRIGSDCLMVVDDRWQMQNWEGARRYCQEKGADLAQLSDQVELASFLQESEYGWSDRYWIGGSDADSEGNWKWLDGTSITEGWYWDQPDDSDTGEDCLYFKTDEAPNGLNDRPCYENMRFICERWS